MNTVTIERAIRAQIKDDNGLRRRFNERVDDIHDTLVRLSPSDTGEFKHSHRRVPRPDVDGLPAARIENNDDKARYIEYGTEDTPEFAVYRRTVGLFT